MRRYIFTERERRLLREWIEEGEETQETRKVLSWIRRGFPLLAEDTSLMFETIRAVQRRRRWREKDHGPQRVRLSTTARRVRIDPCKREADYICHLLARTSGQNFPAYAALSASSPLVPILWTA